MASALSDLYEHDFYEWTRRQARQLRPGADRRINADPEIDWFNVAEEIEDLGKARINELRSRYRVLVMHLLRWLHQPEQRSGSWRATINEQRHEIEAVLEESPSLRERRPERLAKAYPAARRLAADETGIELATFPDECPFSLDEIESFDFWPEP